jgi:hypothetical protein
MRMVLIGTAMLSFVAAPAFSPVVFIALIIGFVVLS